MRKKLLSILLLFLILSGCSLPVSTRPATQEQGSQTPAVPPTGSPTPSWTATLPQPSPGPTLTPLPPLPLGQTVILKALFMIDEQIGWGIDSAGRIVRTRDGGSSWRDVTPPQGAFSEKGFFALDGEHAWAVSPQPATFAPENGVVNPLGWAGLIWHTANGGNTWQTLHIPSNQIAWLSSFEARELFFSDLRNGWLVVADRSQSALQGQTDRSQSLPLNLGLFRTADGGASWTQTDFAFETSDDFTGVTFLDGQVGFTGSPPAGKSGAFEHPTIAEAISGKSVPQLWKTTDGGATWTSLELPRLGPIPKGWQDLAGSEAQMDCGVGVTKSIPPLGILAMAYCQASTGPIPVTFFAYLSADGGRTWRSWVTDGYEDFLNPSMGWRLGYPSNLDQLDELLQTQDGGQAWKPLAKVAWGKVQIDFVNERVGWALVFNTDNALTALVHTTNGGRTWSQLEPKAAIAINTDNASQITRLSLWPAGMVNVVALSPDWSILVTTNNRALQFWQMKNRQAGAYLPIGPDCGLRTEYSVIFSPDGKRLSADLCNATTQIWRVPDGMQLQTLPGEMENGSPFTPDDSGVIVVVNSYAITLWRISDGAALQEFPAEIIDSAAFSPDGGTLAFGAKDGLQLWRVADGTLIKTLDPGYYPYCAVAFSPDGTMLASATESQGLQLWNVRTGTLLATLDNSPYTFEAHKLVFSPAGTILASARYADNGGVTVRLWQIPEGKLLRTLKNVSLPVSFSPDGTQLAVGSSEGLQIWGISGK